MNNYLILGVWDKENGKFFVVKMRFGFLDFVKFLDVCECIRVYRYVCVKR